MKIYSKCQKIKDFNCFHRASGKPDGFKSQCIECRKIPAKKYREENEEKIKNRHKSYYKENCEKIKERSKQHRINNKLKGIKRKKKVYSQEEKDEIKKKRLEYWDKNPLALFKVRVRKAIQCAFSRCGRIKSLHSEEILGCSIEDFLSHITLQFKEGMSLENYGEWHLDYIVPLAIAETEEDVIYLCHYSNYQPLWAEENLAKGCSI